MSTRQQRRRAERNKAKHGAQQPTSKFPVWIVLVGVVAVIGLLVVLAVAQSSDDSRASAGADVVDAGSALPAVHLIDFDGAPVALADYTGKPLVINFWASWCVPCLAEMPGFERVYQAHKGDVDFLGINLQDDPGAAQAVMAQTGISYPVARDPEGVAFVALRARAMPTTIFVSADGQILDLHTGEISASALDAQIASMFDL